MSIIRPDFIFFFLLLDLIFFLARKSYYLNLILCSSLCNQYLFSKNLLVNAHKLVNIHWYQHPADHPECSSSTWLNSDPASIAVLLDDPGDTGFTHYYYFFLFEVTMLYRYGPASFDKHSIPLGFLKLSLIYKICFCPAHNRLCFVVSLVLLCCASHHS